MAPLSEEEIRASVERIHAQILADGALAHSPSCVLPTPAALSQAKVDAWILKGVTSLVDYLESEPLSPSMLQAYHDALPYLEKAFLDSRSSGPMAYVQPFLSRVLPLLVRCIAMRAQYSIEPMDNVNQTQLAHLMERIRAKTVKNVNPPT